MKIGVVTFPDSDRGQNLQVILNKLAKAEIVSINPIKTDFSNVDIVFISNGAQWLDYLISKAENAEFPFIQKIKQYVAEGGYVIGSGEGCRFLCTIELLPGKFEKNKTGRFIGKNIHIRVDNARTAVTYKIDKNKSYKLPLATLDGRYTANNEQLSLMHQNNQILFRYCDENCKISEKVNVTGSDDNIAAICNEQGNVFGIVPYPERACMDRIGNTDGLPILQSLLSFINENKKA